MLAGGLVVLLAEAANEFFENVAHLDVVHPIGVQINLLELFEKIIEEVGGLQAGHLAAEIEFFDNIAHFITEAVEVVDKVLLYVCGSIQQALPVEFGIVVHQGLHPSSTFWVFNALSL